MRFPTTILALALPLFLAAAAPSPSLTVQLPDDARPQSAVATAPQLKLDTKPSIDGHALTFPNLLPDTAYDLKITLADGSILQGVDLAWYALEPEKKDAPPMDDDDRQQITELFDGIKAFENKRNMLFLAGNHDHATVLAELIRDTPFYAGAGQVIWRVELWYFKNQHGGWEKVAQASKVLRRERFKTAQDYRNETAALRWLPQLGGVRLAKDETKTITLKPEDLKNRPEPK